MSTQSHTLLETLGKNYKFKVDFEDGIIITDTLHSGEKNQVKIVSPKTVPRECKMDIFKYHGAIGACHYYVRLKLGYPNHVYASNGKHYIYSSYNNPDHPLGVHQVDIELMRRINKRDLAHDKFTRDHDIIFMRMKKGDWTHGFWSVDDAVNAGLKFFKEHFDTGWILVLDSYAGDVKPIFASTTPSILPSSDEILQAEKAFF